MGSPLGHFFAVFMDKLEKGSLNEMIAQLSPSKDYVGDVTCIADGSVNQFVHYEK